MRSILGQEGVISEREQLRSYECDGLMNYRVIPELVVLPETAEQVQKIVRVCYDEGIPFVARGSGTGLSGGALPAEAGKNGRASWRGRGESSGVAVSLKKKKLRGYM